MVTTTSKFIIDKNLSVNANYVELKKFIVGTKKVLKMTKPILKPNSSSTAIREYANELEKYEFNINELKEESNNSKEIIKDAYNTFDFYIKDESGLFNIPKEYQDKVYKYAYEKGHGDGYIEIFNELLELVQIFE